MTQRVAKDTIVTLEYSVRDTDGAVVDAGSQPLVYLHGGYDDIFPRIEAALDGKPVGHQLTLRLEPADAFGDYDAELIRLEDQDSFPEGLAVGSQFTGPAEIDGEAVEMVFTVTDMAEGRVVLDGNHPLAGMALDFSCTVSEVRKATAEEIGRSSAHR